MLSAASYSSHHPKFGPFRKRISFVGCDYAKISDPAVALVPRTQLAELHFENSRNVIDLPLRACHFDIYRKDDSVAALSEFLRALLNAITARPPVPCCASAIHWASLR